MKPKRKRTPYILLLLIGFLIVLSMAMCAAVATVEPETCTMFEC